MELLGKRAWNHTVIVFTHKDWLGNTTIEKYIESERALQCLLKKCGDFYHVLNNKDKSNKKQITDLLEKINLIVTKNRGNPYVIKKETKRQQWEAWASLRGSLGWFMHTL